MELFPKDYVTELTTKKLGNSLGFLTITHMTLSAKQFRCYGIFTIDIAAGFCFLTEEQLNGSSVSILGLTKILEVPNTILVGNSLSFPMIHNTAPNG
jgi:hypothetical protein